MWGTTVLDTSDSALRCQTRVSFGIVRTAFWTAFNRDVFQAVLPRLGPLAGVGG
jgi:hypothetical protein